MGNIKIGVATAHFYSSVQSLFEQEIEVAHVDSMHTYDLIVFTGGADIHPSIYGEKNTHSHCNIGRDKIELSTFRLAKKYSIKMFGICRGHQFLNALTGGKLIQDLGTFKKSHSGYHELIITEPNSAIGKIYSEVNSIHHQGVETAGKDLTVTSTFKGVIESVEGEDIISVQWHPEFMLDTQASKLSEYLKSWAKQK